MDVGSQEFGFIALSPRKKEPLNFLKLKHSSTISVLYHVNSIYFH